MRGKINKYMPTLHMKIVGMLVGVALFTFGVVPTVEGFVR